jgi:hypothetical protein
MVRIKNQALGDSGVAQVIEHLPSKYEAPSSNPRTTDKKNQPLYQSQKEGIAFCLSLSSIMSAAGFSYTPFIKLRKFHAENSYLLRIFSGIDAGFC